MTDRPATRTPLALPEIRFLVHRSQRWRRIFALCTVLAAFAGPWLSAVGLRDKDPAFPDVLVLMAWTGIGGLAKGVARPLIARDADLYRRATPVANRLFLLWMLPVGGLLVAAAALAGSEVLLAVLFYLGLPGVLLVTRLIELVALWIAPDGRRRGAAGRPTVTKRG